MAIEDGLPADPADTDDLPVLAPPPEDDELVEALREMQYVLLAHPVAAQAGFAALVAEGRRFGRTAEGEAWRLRLAGSDLIRQARVVWEVASMKMLEENPPGVLPSSWIETFAAAARRPQLEDLLSKLVGPDPGGRDDLSR